MSPTSYLLLYPAILDCKYTTDFYSRNGCNVFLSPNCFLKSNLCFLAKFILFFFVIFRMRKRIKKGMWVVLGLVILILLAFFIATPIVENTIKTKIAEQIPDHVKLSPYELSVSFVGRSVEIKNIKLTQKDSLFSTNKEFISVEKLSVEGIHFFKLLLSDEVSIKNILIETPIIRL